MNRNERLERKLRADFDGVRVPDTLAPENLDAILDKSQKKTSAKTWVLRIASVAAALAIVVGAAFALQHYASNITPTHPSDLLPTNAGTAEDYGEIYSALKKHEKLYSWRIYVSNAKGDDLQPSAEQATDKPSDYSGTNLQVEGVDEADFVKTDGKYIYVVSDSVLRVFDVSARRVVGTCAVDKDARLIDMYLIDGYVSIVFSKVQEREEYYGYGWYYRKGETGVLTIDATNPEAPKIISEKLQSGGYVTSRAIGQTVYLVTQYGVWSVPEAKSSIEDYIPYVREGDGIECLPAESITLVEDTESSNEFVVISAYDAKNGEITDSKSMFGYGFDVYCALGRMYIYSTYYVSPIQTEGVWSIGAAYTSINCFEIEGGKITAGASASLIGTANNQFSFHYQGGYLYVCTTFEQEVALLPDAQKALFSERKSVNSNGIFALDGELKIVDSIKHLGLDETIRSARYVGDMCYFVTFRQTDPLFAVDISNPKALKLVGELKIPGFSTYLHPYSDGLLLGFGYDADDEGRTTGLKLSMFDTSNPADIAEISKLVINGEHGVHSEALYNHKAIYVNASKRLIGIPLAVYTDQGETVSYCLYRFSDGGYEQVCDIAPVLDGEYIDRYYYYAYDFVARGLHIDDAFYCVSADGVTAVSLEDFAPLFTVKF